jgi:hypothetical protein
VVTVSAEWSGDSGDSCVSGVSVNRSVGSDIGDSGDRVVKVASVHNDTGGSGTMVDNDDSAVHLYCTDAGSKKMIIKKRK